MAVCKFWTNGFCRNGSMLALARSVAQPPTLHFHLHPLSLNQLPRIHSLPNPTLSLPFVFRSFHPNI
jgi:hypothetical protein